MAWTGYNGDPRKLTVQQPQMPSLMPCPTPAFCPGHVKEADLVELMMIQNAQMHQVIMNNVTMLALRSFGYSQTSPAPETIGYPVIVEKEPMEVFHHYYQPAPSPAYITWIPPPQAHPTVVYQHPADHQDPVSAPLLNRCDTLVKTV
ncbi:proline-rich protein 29-like [Arapaima gigas]